MKSKRISLNTFIPVQEDRILIDTNILIKIFYPTNFDLQSNPYETLFSNIIKGKSKLLLSSIQVSEFINTCIRFEYKYYQKETGNVGLNYKKGYRSTDHYRIKMESILDIIKNDMMPFFEFIDDGFSRMDRDNIFIYGFSYDFNDSLLAEIARTQNAFLVTDDADYVNFSSNCRIVTSNKILLNSH